MMMPKCVLFQPSAVYIINMGTTVAAPGTMRMDSSMNIMKPVSLGFKREKAYAARKETIMAITIADSEITMLFVSAVIKIRRENKSRKLSSVGTKKNLGGHASISILVLNADRIIQSTGRKKSTATTHSRT